MKLHCPLEARPCNRVLTSLHNNRQHYLINEAKNSSGVAKSPLSTYFSWPDAGSSLMDVEPNRVIKKESRFTFAFIYKYIYEFISGI